MVKKIAALMTLLALTTALAVTIYASKDDVVVPANLTVHEWGTFTSVAGPDGKAAQWLPLAGPGDLPCFVNFFQDRRFKSLGPLVQSDLRNPVSYEAAKSELLGPIRMETPVVYFYAQKSQKVNVRVAFPKGYITEWFPQGTVNQTVRTGVLQKSINTGATITWKNVEILPGMDSALFPKGSFSSHYYAARATDATPIRVSGQSEKFLFYRGVGGFPVPVNVTTTDTGKIHIKYLTGKPSAILFENRGGKLGYTLVDVSQNEVVLDSPALTKDFDSLRRDLEAILVHEGLYPKEAQAMVDTWRDSWFEEGTRLFYIVPSAMVDTILPLSIDPKPAHVARVFVGRVEVFTPKTIKAVERALASNDTSILSTYGRFLGPIMERISVLKREPMLDAAFRQYIEQAASCSK